MKCHAEDPSFPVGQSLALGEHVEGSLGEEGSIIHGQQKAPRARLPSHRCLMVREKKQCQVFKR